MAVSLERSIPFTTSSINVFPLFSQPAAIATVMIQKPCKLTYTDPMLDKLKQCTTEEVDDLLPLYLHFFTAYFLSFDLQCIVIQRPDLNRFGYLRVMILPQRDP